MLKGTTLKLILFLCLLFSAMHTKAQRTAGNYSLSGTVVSCSTHQPVAGILVSVDKIGGVLTDSSGHFSFTGLRKGKYRLEIMATTYNDNDTTVVIDSSSVTNMQWAVCIECRQYNAERAQKDIAANQAFLLCYSWFRKELLSSRDFKKKYGVEYNRMGCLQYEADTCLLQYNQTVINYLDRTYGAEWRKEAGGNVLGLK